MVCMLKISFSRASFNVFLSGLLVDLNCDEVKKPSPIRRKNALAFAYFW